MLSSGYKEYQQSLNRPNTATSIQTTSIHTYNPPLTHNSGGYPHLRCLLFYMNDLVERLERLGLSQYLEVFVAEGFDSWETILDITESDL